MSENEKERLLDLLTDRVLFGLSPEQETELKTLEAQYPGVRNDDSFDLTASAINLTKVETIEPLPAHLRAKILAAADEFFAEQSAPANVINFQPRLREVAPPIDRAATTATRIAPHRAWQWLGWTLAAAACIALALNLWLTRGAIQTVPLSAAVQREQLLREAPDVIRAEWTEPNPAAPRGVSGDVVWSNSRQQGYIRLRGVPPNDRSRESYQFWIIDANQDAETPIDGGIFDVSETGEVVIPINAKLKVEKPQGFAITAEKPGGVVVSKQNKMMAIAKVSV